MFGANGRDLRPCNAKLMITTIMAESTIVIGSANFSISQTVENVILIGNDHQQKKKKSTLHAHMGSG